MYAFNLCSRAKVLNDVTMQFDSREVVFRYSVQCLSVSDIKTKLQNAVRANRLVLRGSNDYCMHLNSQVNSIAISMDGEYSNFQLAQCQNGVLLMNESYCLKKPQYEASNGVLLHLSNLSDDLPFIQYRPLLFGFFHVEKYIITCCCYILW